jgi:PEGA domain
VVPTRGVSLPSLPSIGQSIKSTSRMSSTRRRFTRMKRRTRRNVVVAVGAVALLGAGALAERRFGPPPPPKGPGTLVLATTPAGATLKVDGKELGDRSPAVVQLEPGKHELEAEMPHFLPVKMASVDVKPAASHVLRMPMTHDTYRVSITSEPEGASVQLDGFNIGTTPLEYDVDPWDQHTLRLERLGRRAWEKYLPTGERPREIHAELKKRESGDAEE